MPAADVQQLVQDLSDGLADATASTNYYGDVLTDLALDPDGFHTDVSSIGVTAAPAINDVALPAASVTELILVYDTVHLSYINSEEATLFASNWRATQGFPRAWVDDTSSKHAVKLVPGASVTSAGTVDPTSAGPGLFRLTVIYTMVPTDPSPDAELAVALEILAREFSRDSDHTDSTAAEICRTLAGSAFKMLGAGLDDNLPPILKAELET